MENKNIMNLTTAENNAKAMAATGTVDTKTMQAQSPQQPLPPITMKTTLGELLAMLDLGEKPPVPTPRELFETAGEPIAKMRGCTLFRNGYAIYQNTTGRTVVWLPYCKNFTYRFNKLKDSEKDTLKETYSLPEGYMEKQRWVIAVTLIGDHRIERNCMNRTSSRKDTVDLASKDKGDKDGAMEEAIADPYRRAFNWYDGHIGENPQDAIERHETREEMLAAMTDKQREVFIMYYRDAMTQEQIAAVIGVSRPAVTVRLSYALEVARKFLYLSGCDAKHRNQGGGGAQPRHSPSPLAGEVPPTGGGGAQPRHSPSSLAGEVPPTGGGGGGQPLR